MQTAEKSIIAAGIFYRSNSHA